LSSLSKHQNYLEDLLAQVFGFSTPYPCQDFLIQMVWGGAQNLLPNI
jgi:hypothetical protein